MGKFSKKLSRTNKNNKKSVKSIEGSLKFTQKDAKALSNMFNKLFGEVDEDDYFELTDEVIYEKDELFEAFEMIENGYFNKFIDDDHFPIKGMKLTDKNADGSVSSFTVKLAKHNANKDGIEYLIEQKFIRDVDYIAKIRLFQYDTKPYRTMIEDLSCSAGIIMNEEVYKRLDNKGKNMVHMLEQNARQAMSLFLLVQLLYLNPVTKEIFPRYGTRSGSSGHSSTHNSSPTKHVKYIRKLNLEDGALKTYAGKLASARHYEKDAWYVNGHYRIYHKTGKEIWIDGYWKGKLRSEHTIEPRKRLINTSTHREFIN